ncbi:hypothetical protein [Kibdelosporangium aridum]|uniref:hypothetical protein n=1 Tax=Kibdelosporangium aridum TaxID=2030 RepID=UPI0035EF5BA7
MRIAHIAHSTTDRAGFLVQLIALAKEKGFGGYPGDGANVWNAAHVRDVTSLFRLELEKGPAGRYWHAVGVGAVPLREMAEATGSRLGLPVVSVPADVLMVPEYFGSLANVVTQNYPAPLPRAESGAAEQSSPRLLGATGRIPILYWF